MGLSDIHITFHRKKIDSIQIWFCSNFSNRRITKFKPKFSTRKGKAERSVISDTSKEIWHGNDCAVR